MKLATQRRLAAAILKVGKYRVWIDPSRLSDIKEAITRADVRDLIKDNVVQKKRKVGQSKSRFRKDLKQKRKGRRKGSGSKKGKRTARLPRKKAWMIQIRSQREFIKALRDKKIIDQKLYRDLYVKARGNVFRSKRHIRIYLEGLKKNES